MTSHSVTCHPAEVTFLPLPHQSWYSVILDVLGNADEAIFIVYIKRSSGCVQQQTTRVAIVINFKKQELAGAQA